VGAYVLRRLLLALPTVVGITLLTFAALRLAPGDPFTHADLRNGAAAREETARLRAELDLDRSLPVAYARWAARAATFDLGTSLRTGRPVAETVADRLPVTVGLGIGALALVYLLGIPLGLAAAVSGERAQRAGAGRGIAGLRAFGPGALDRALSTGLFVLYAVPPFWAGTMALLLLGGGNYLDLIPVRGIASPGAETLPAPARILDVLHHAAAPVTLLAYGSLAAVFRQVRSAGITALGEEHVRAARARGLPERTVLLRHAFRGALLPVVSHAGLMVPFVVGGSVVVERIFGIPGIGELLYVAILHRDHPVILGVVTVASLVTLAGVLLVDLLYAVVDPRVVLERR
jgi:peptide/nickel transport system permease protein